MGLEGQHHPLVAHGAHGFQSRLQLVGMVGIIVVNVRTVELALELHPPSRAVEGLDALGNRLPGNAHHPGGGRRRQRVHGIVPSQHAHIQMAVVFPVADHVKVPPVGVHIGRVNAVSFPKAEGNIVDALHGLHRMGVVAVGDHAEGGKRRELVEGLLNVRQILEIVQVIRFHIQHDCQGGEEIQEGITVFAALQHDGVPVADPVSRVEQGQIAADHDRGIHIRFHKDVGQHGRGGGLSVCAGDADGVMVGLHDLAPCLRPLKHGDACGTGGSDLRVVIVGGGSADDAVRDGDGNALFDQLIRGHGCVHIRTSDLHAHALQHQTQRPHGYAADPHKMHMMAGRQIFRDFLTIQHVCQFPHR